MSVLNLQRRLQALGADPGPADGIAGTRTAAAMRQDMEARYGVGFNVTALGARGLMIGGPQAAPVARPVAGGPSLRQGSAGYEVTEIVVHCADTPKGWLSNQPLDAKVREIRRWHRDNGWRDIGYHWVIDTDGALAAGRPETEIGAGVRDHNRGVIHICLIGGHGSAASDEFGEHFTLGQDDALRSLIRSIQSRARIRRVSGHNEWAAKACPGFHVPTWLEGA